MLSGSSKRATGAQKENKILQLAVELEFIFLNHQVAKMSSQPNLVRLQV